jgi:hypothetical protein
MLSGRMSLAERETPASRRDSEARAIAEPGRPERRPAKTTSAIFVPHGRLRSVRDYRARRADQNGMSSSGPPPPPPPPPPP